MTNDMRRVLDHHGIDIVDTAPGRGEGALPRFEVVLNERHTKTGQRVWRKLHLKRGWSTEKAAVDEVMAEIGS